MTGTLNDYGRILRAVSQYIANGKTLTQFVAFTDPVALQSGFGAAYATINGSTLTFTFWSTSRGYKVTSSTSSASNFRAPPTKYKDDPTLPKGKEVVEESFRIHGGYGYSKEYEIERLMRQAPFLLIGEGTSEIQKTIISRGLMREYGVR